MYQQFNFSQRHQCICGDRLNPGSKKVEKFFLQGRVTFQQCGSCGTFIQAPQLDDQSLKEWYDSIAYQGGNGKRGIGYINYTSDEEQRAAEASLRFRRDFAPYLPSSARFCEIGAASGALLAEARSHGHIPLGCDLSEKFVVAAAQHFGLRITKCDWLSYEIEHKSLDAIVMLGTISNLANLQQSLEKAREKLRESGFLFFNFPAADSLPARLYGKNMWMFTPSVAQFMTRAGVNKLLAATGFKIEHLAVDRQAPTLSKLLGHAKIGFLYPFFKKIGLSGLSPVFAVPVPGVLAVRARTYSQ